METQEDDMASSGFGNCLTRDGQGQATANLPMATFRHTDVGNGVNLTDYAALGQVLAGQINWVVAGGSSDAITATYVPAIASLTDGQLCFFRATAANSTTTPTFAPNSLTAHTITKFGGSPVQADDIPGEYAEVILRYNLANTRWELLNPAGNPAQERTPVNDAAYAVLASDRIVAYTAISTARVVTLIAAASYPAGAVLTVIDESGSCSLTDTITITRAGSDVIASSASASATTFVLNNAFASVQLESNGSGQWTVINQASTILHDQTITGGANVKPYSLGTYSTGSYTVDCGKGPLQYATNGGSFTLAAPSNDGACDILIINNGSAGTITFSGFTINSNYVGAIPDTTNAHQFIISVVRINGSSIYNVIPQQ